MQSMRKTVVAMALFGASIGLGLAKSAQAEVNIGFMATLSGPAGAIGQDQYDAFMLALELNGGKLGGQTVRIFKEDDQLKPDLGVQIARKLIEKDQVHLITGFTFSNVLMAVLKPVSDKEVFMVGSNAGPGLAAGKQCSPYFFSSSYTNENDSEGMGAYANQAGYKRVMLLGPNYQAGRDSLSGFKRFYKGQIVDEIYTQLNQPDYQAEISQIQLQRPDAVFVFYPGGMGINFIKQYRQSGLLGKVPLLSASTVDGTTLPALGEIALGTVTVSHWGPDLDNETNKTFVAAFEKKYGRIPSKYAATAYDSALLIDSALRRVGGKLDDKEALRAAFRAADYKSTRGSYRYNNNGFPIQNYYQVEVGKDAKGRVNLVTRNKVLSDHADAYGATQCPIK